MAANVPWAENGPDFECSMPQGLACNQRNGNGQLGTHGVTRVVIWEGQRGREDSESGGGRPEGTGREAGGGACKSVGPTILYLSTLRGSMDGVIVLPLVDPLPPPPIQLPMRQ
jgi:hypothetical protein